jgi:hypothetical protein
VSEERRAPEDEGLEAVMVFTTAEADWALFLINPESIAGEG